MTRLSLCALAVALAAGQCLAVPTTVERAMHRFGDMEAYQENGENGDSDSTEESTSTTTTTTTASTETTETTTQEQWLDCFLKAVQRQLMLQEQLMRQLIKDIVDYFNNVLASTEQGTAFTKVHEMMDMISNRMATAREAANDVAAASGTMESETLRNATRKFMKEVRVQDVVVDALWASLRGVQTSAWMTGVVASEERGDTYSVANRAAEEFLTRMYHNLRAAGISEDDIVKFVPKAETETSEPGRNMGKRGYYGYGRSYGYYGYGYPRYYSYGYPSYYSYGYPSYYSYGYPSYYSYGYPSYYYSYPYYSSYYYRRLRPTPGTAPPPAATPMMGPPAPMMTPPTPTPTPTMVPPFPPMAPFRSMFQEPPPMGENPMMTGQGYGPMEYPMEEMPEPMEPMMPPTPYEMPTTSAYTPTRNLAPFTDVAGIFPEPSPMMGPMQAMPPFPFGPEMPTPF